MGEILAWDALRERVAAGRARGRSVALAVGCFDPFHAGHARFLAAAAEQADVLVVAVFDDASTRTLKGQGRPLVAAEHRAEILGAIRWVDHVGVVGGQTAAALVTALAPDVYCVGEEPAADAPIRDVVHACGARLAVVGGPKDQSTTTLVARMAGSPRTASQP